MIIFEIPTAFIIVLILGLLGFNLAPIIQTLAVISVFINFFAFFVVEGGKAKFEVVLLLVLSIFLMLHMDGQDISLYDILGKLF
jgi:hypothetical protein